MSLQLSISAVEETNSFIVNDCTGLFSPENKGGFGVQNPRYEDIESAILEITPPFDSTPFLEVIQQNPPSPDYTIFIAPTFTVDVFPDFPNMEQNGYEVLPYMVGSNDFIESGKWKIKLIITGTDKSGRAFKKTAVTEAVFINSVTCCVDKLQPAVNKDLFKDKRQQAIIELSNLLESACNAVEKELLDQADGIIRLLKAQCACCVC